MWALHNRSVDYGWTHIADGAHVPKPTRNQLNEQLQPYQASVRSFWPNHFRTVRKLRAISVNYSTFGLIEESTQYDDDVVRELSNRTKKDEILNVFRKVFRADTFFLPRFQMHEWCLQYLRGCSNVDHQALPAWSCWSSKNGPGFTLDGNPEFTKRTSKPRFPQLRSTFWCIFDRRKHRLSPFQYSQLQSKKLEGNRIFPAANNREDETLLDILWEVFEGSFVKGVHQSSYWRTRQWSSKHPHIMIGDFSRKTKLRTNLPLNKVTNDTDAEIVNKNDHRFTQNNNQKDAHKFVVSLGLSPDLHQSLPVAK